jgi:ribosome-binding factor A
MAKPFSRMERVNEQIRTVLAEQIREHLELDLHIVVTVTKVITAKDLSHAKILVVVFPDNATAATLSVLQSRAKKLRHLLSQEIIMRTVPELHFHEDESERYGQKMDRLLDSLHKK